LIALLLISVSVQPAAASHVLRELSQFDKDFAGWTASGGWRLNSTPRVGATSRRHAECGEVETGVLRSDPFEIRGDVVEFLANGWDGRDGGLGLNGYYLRDAETGAILRTARPPLNDAFAKIAWIVSDLRGRRVVFEAVDGDHTLHGAGFAWVGLDRVAEVALDVPGGESRMRPLLLPAGGIWRIIDWDGQHRRVEPYLSSLADGEPATGGVRGPDFQVQTDAIRLVLLGHDGVPGPAKSRNYAALIEAETGRELARVSPPRTDDPTEVVMDTSAARGKTAFLLFVDGLAENGFAWMGVHSIRFGAEAIRFAGPELPPGWHPVTPAGQEFVQAVGVPFSHTGAPARITAEGCEVPIGVPADRIYICGLVNSFDQGCPCWGPANAVDQRLFLGDDIGSMVLRYADGAEDVVPLRLGYTAWWWDPIVGQGAREPFASDPRGKKLLDAALHLAPTGGAQAAAYLLPLRPRPGRALRSIILRDNPAKAGYPYVSAITIESAQATGLPALPYDRPSPEQSAWMERNAIDAASPWPPQAEAALQALRAYLYTGPADFHKGHPLQVPAHYRGPVARFEGNPYADALTNEWYWNIHDMDLKVDSGDGVPGPNWYWPDVPAELRRQSEPGTFHTSTLGAPSWGSYTGFGTFRKGYNAYTEHAWSRDYGRVMQELVELGFLPDSALSAQWAFRWARWFPEHVKLPDGSPAPAHWCRVVNHPEWFTGETAAYGNAENDGQGLMGLWAYKHWLHAPDPSGWARDNFADIARVPEHVIWQMDNPKLSGFDRVLLTNSECSAGVGRGHYADVFCWHMMMGCAEIAESIGRAAEAACWRTYAGRLLDGINAVYLDRTPEGRPIWTLRNVGWPHQMAAMAAIMACADRLGFDLADELPQWAEADRQAYRRAITQQCFPPYSAAPAMGYGQCFLTECALMTDNMADATRCVENLARYAYSPLYASYITPEGCEVDVERGYWHRTGDLGNAVQQGESVKVMRLVLGVDDVRPADTRFMPRLPMRWTGMSVADYPVLTLEGTRRLHRKLEYRLERSAGGYRLRWSADGALHRLSVRLGPFSREPFATATVNGKGLAGEVVRSGDSWWLWVRDLRPTARGELVARR
jgi:hypothetical protein